MYKPHHNIGCGANTGFKNRLKTATAYKPLNIPGKHNIVFCIFNNVNLIIYDLIFLYIFSKVALSMLTWHPIQSIYLNYAHRLVDWMLAIHD